MKSDQVVVIDFGSQYNQLICRRIRELGVYSELKSHKIMAQDIKKLTNVKGIILSGSPNTVTDKDSFGMDPEILNLGIPVMGICYGMQLITYMNGGIVEKASEREYGKTEIKTNKDGIFENLPEDQIVWMSHGYHVKTLPLGFKVSASSESCPIAGAFNEDKNIHLVQFHPEVEHSVYGTEILKNFIFKICKAEANWSMSNFVEDQIVNIREQVGDKKVLCALSGGVDSSVVAALIYKAIGNQLLCMFIDNGLLREGEAQSVVDTFDGKFKMNFVKVDAQERFLNKLKGVSDPEQKRKIIGNEFVFCFEEETSKLNDFEFLAQGTLYTDVIESGTSTAQTIKSHHNVGGLPENMKFKLIEPLNTLFKDEVRELGLELGLPESIVYRQPFPGPGLGIRVIGEVTEEKLKILKQADKILRDEIEKAGLNREIWQYFACLTNMKSVGVMGDERTYSYTVALRAVISSDGMTSDWARIPYEVLDVISRRIVNEVNDVNRIVYDITSKPPSTIEFE
ncbi:glutamine-hydrolyzing GMP synthase [Candidatus Arthromitus sp. SFB-rat-Yit]|uniref:glutamine-hydrolyzing GMP synthase n=1 Tax=Candidatus Arthromitus sp. SFB-rat-Yit TaxID=1041504 RepID=UPI000227A6CB|nr:glutamine-hydrolyzing GMP synthase [Candidatus Arthromitus sp. SFB-rat-Yit]BAK81097.1 GMP synthase (glutamine-hydrolyzing), C-terminal domain protein [Candidatus Arthromitus sp. SFB-rat-Yit]